MEFQPQNQRPEEGGQDHKRELFPAIIIHTTPGFPTQNRAIEKSEFK